MKKKIAIGALSAVLALSALTTTFAANSETAKTDQKEAQNKEKEAKKTTSWDYNGVKFTVETNHDITDKEKEVFQNMTQLMQNKSASGTGTVGTESIPDPGYSSNYVSGPAYRTFDNTVFDYIVEGAVRVVSDWMTRKIPSGQYDSIVRAATQMFVTKITNAIHSHDHVYSGFWNTKAYNDYYGFYEAYETLVNYSNSDYTSPYEVFYQSTGVATP